VITPPKTTMIEKMTAGTNTTYPSTRPAIACPRPLLMSLRVSLRPRCPKITARIEGIPKEQQPDTTPTMPSTIAAVAMPELGRVGGWTTTTWGGGG
jgi:hypothetical protein